MERVRLILRKISNFFKYLFFGKDWKSDFLFILFVIIIVIAIGYYYPFIDVVVSSSMEHTAFNCLKYERFNITCQEFEHFPFSNGINVGSIVIILPVNLNNLKVGDVVLYKYDGIYILHRIVKIENESGKLIFCVMGDNNPGPLPFECPLQGKIIGEAVLDIPYLGYPRYFLYKYLGI